MALSDMPADVEQAFNTLLQAELNHRRKQQQAESQRAQQEQLMQIESQKLSNEMFQNALKGQLETKSLQLKSAQQQSDKTLEMYKFLSEQEDKRQLAREKQESDFALKSFLEQEKMRRQVLGGEQSQADIEFRGKQERLTAVTRGEQTRETAAVRLAGKLQLAELNNSAHLKRINKKHNLDLKLSTSQNEFKAKQAELNRAFRATLQENQLASAEKTASKGRALRRYLQRQNLTFKELDNQLNRDNRLAIAGLKAGNTDATRESQVKNLRNLAKTYRIMTAASSGADMMDLTGGKHNPESRAYMKIMAALDTAASDVEARGGNWREVLNTYLQTNEIQLALANSGEAAAQFKTLELFLKEGGEMPKIKTQGQQGDVVPTEYEYEPEPEPVPGGGGFGGDAGKQKAYDEMD